MSAPTLTLPEFLDGVKASSMWTPRPQDDRPHCGGCLACTVEKLVILQDLALDFGRLPSMG